MSVRVLILTAGLAVTAFFSLSVSGHAEHEKARYVATRGLDSGRCDEVNVPCRTVAYAAGQAGKGDRIHVSGGNYELANAVDIFYLTSGVVGVYGGYTQDFAKRSPDEHPTTLIGVPVQFRESLERRGFRVIVDRKGLSDDEDARLATLMGDLRLLKTSASAEPCADGSAAGFSCNRIDLASHMPLDAFSTRPSGANDIWGFVDLNTEREYAIIGLRNGAAVVDVSDPENPLEVGSVTGQESVWRDVKVLQTFDAAAERWNAYAYVTTDGAGDRLAIIDLTGLPNAISLAGRRTDDDSAHNVYLANADYATGVPLAGLEPLLIIAGSNQRDGAFRVYGLADPLNPALLAESPSGGYMHDATSLVIDDARSDTQCTDAGPGCVVLVDFNELTFELWDLPTGIDAALLSTTSYDNAGYVHSGWYSEDKQYVFVHDELDEQQNGLNTTLRVFGIADLGAPALVGTWTGPTAAVDHNGYVRGNRYYISNYTRGLTVLDITDPTQPIETGRFDSYPLSDGSAFNGAWGVYPFLPSGLVLVSDINSGLYVLEDSTRNSPSGSLAFSRASFSGIEGQTVRIGINRLDGSAGGTTVGYEMLAGSAGAEDFVTGRGRVSWAAAEAGEREIDITLAVDALDEGVERFFVRLFDPRDGATLAPPAMASVFVREAGAANEIAMFEGTVPADEGSGRALVTVRRTGNATGAASVGFSTAEDTASGGSDYEAVNSGRLDWADGDVTARVISVTVVDDEVEEAEEQFAVTLSAPSGAVLGSNVTTGVTIRDDDANAAPVANAGIDQIVDEGSAVTLEGGESNDPDEDPLTFMWVQTGGPPVTLIDADRASAQFTAPNVTAGSGMEFELSVADEHGLVATDRVSVTVRNVGGSSGSGGGAVAFIGLIAVLLLIGRRQRAALPGTAH